VSEDLPEPGSFGVWMTIGQTPAPGSWVPKGTPVVQRIAVLPTMKWIEAGPPVPC